MEKIQTSTKSGSISRYLLPASLILSFLTIFLLTDLSFWYSPYYPFMVILVAGLLLLSLYKGERLSGRFQWVLISAVVAFHISFLFYHTGVHISERFPAVLRMIEAGHWDTSFGLHPVYDPFPFGDVFYATVSLVISKPLISPLTFWPTRIALVISFDLVLYSIVKRITGRKIAAALAIFILAVTPPSQLLTHPARWPGLLLALISVLFLIRAGEGHMPRIDSGVAVGAYAMAIYYYPASAIGIFFILGILTVDYFARRTESFNWGVDKRGLLKTSIVLFSVITVARAIYSQGFLQPIIPQVRLFVTSMFGFSPTQASLPPLYNRAGASPLHSYSWVISGAMGTALLIYSVMRRKIENGYVTALYLAGAFFAFSGFLFSLTSWGNNSTFFVCFAFLAPAAGLVAQKILRGGSDLAPIALVGLLLLSVGFAVRDPMLSPAGFSSLKGGEPVTESNFTQTRTVFTFLNNAERYSLTASKPLQATLRYIETSEGGNLPRSTGKYALENHLRLLRKNRLAGNFIYFFQTGLRPTEPLHPMDVMYDSGSYQVFKGSGKREDSPAS